MKELISKNKEQFAVYFIIIVSCFLIFYWTHLIFNHFKTNISSETSVIAEKISKAEALVHEIKSTSKNKSKKIESSLLAFMQNQTRRLGFEDKLIVLKPKTDVKGIEGAVLRFERFNLNDFLNLIEMLDKYENITIDTFSLTKRFDNPKLANLNMELSKTR